jgi:hypothetical protein
MQSDNPQQPPKEPPEQELKEQPQAGPDAGLEALRNADTQKLLPISPDTSLPIP